MPLARLARRRHVPNLAPPGPLPRPGASDIERRHADAVAVTPRPGEVVPPEPPSQNG